MTFLMEGVLFSAAGIAVFALAPRLSQWEREITQVLPWTKLTGWSGTPRGIFVWQVVGALLVALEMLCVWIVRWS